MTAKARSNICVPKNPGVCSPPLPEFPSFPPSSWARRGSARRDLVLTAELGLMGSEPRLIKINDGDNAGGTGL